MSRWPEARDFIRRPGGWDVGPRPKERDVRRPAAAVLVAALIAASAASCKEHQIEVPTRAERVEEAEAAFDPAMFDTISWASQEARIEQGNEVFAAECRKCHGTLGKGGTDYAREQELDVPSLVEPDWEFRADLAGVRRRIFTGHEEGMPTLGIAGLSPREIDAVAAYVIDDLRPEVLGSRAP